MQFVTSSPSIRKTRDYVDVATRLLRRAAKGDREAFERLYSGYRRVVVAALIRTADDADPATLRRQVQEVFQIAWERRKSCNADQTAQNFFLRIVSDLNPSPASLER